MNCSEYKSNVLYCEKETDRQGRRPEDAEAASQDVHAGRGDQRRELDAQNAETDGAQDARQQQSSETVVDREQRREEVGAKEDLDRGRVVQRPDFVHTATACDQLVHSTQVVRLERELVASPRLQALHRQAQAARGSASH